MRIGARLLRVFLHADFGVTMKIYTHLSSEKETAGIEKLNEHLDQLLGSTIGDKVKEGQ